VGKDVPGMTVNRYCASGLETIAIATAKIRSGLADCIIAGGVESMSLVPTAGWKTAPNYTVASTDPDYYLSMGLTAEAVAQQFKVNREDQDEFSYNSHQKAITAIESGYFKDGILTNNRGGSLPERKRQTSYAAIYRWIPMKVHGAIQAGRRLPN
jgi:acetyl-CoA acyltransferase